MILSVVQLFSSWVHDRVAVSHPSEIRHTHVIDLANSVCKEEISVTSVRNFKSQYTFLPPATGIIEIVLRWGPCLPGSLSD